MSKLYFKTGTMGSGKSLDLIRTVYNYKERGMDITVLKPKVDDRNGTDKCIIWSRTGASCDADWINDDTNILKFVEEQLKSREIKAVVVDEVQFCEEEQIVQLSDIVTELDIPVITYGLKSNFKGDLFKSISTLFAYADDIQEIRSICWCGKRANHNARIIDGKIVKTGKIVEIGGNEQYIALCNKHFKKEQLK